MENKLNLEDFRERRIWNKRAMFIPVAIVTGILIFGSLVMYLWNTILPGVLGVQTITFWQAVGILILSKILFGGFPGRHSHRGFYKHNHDLREKWLKLTPEEREKMKADLKSEWRSRFDRKVKED
jgi:Ca2+/H+ antiporter, TMEM165/GDT1 family